MSLGCDHFLLGRQCFKEGLHRQRGKRPGFDNLCRDATKRQFNNIMAWSVDRLGQSLQDLVVFLSEIHALRIDLYLHQQGFDTTTPAGKAMFQMMGVFAEFERAMIAECVRAGMARARENGTKSGNAIGRPRIDGRRSGVFSGPERAFAAPPSRPASFSEAIEALIAGKQRRTDNGKAAED